MRLSRTARLLLSLVAVIALPAGASAAEAETDELGALRERVAALEARLDLVDRKFRLLAADDVSALLASGEVLGDPALLVDQADAALAREDWPLAYRYLALIHTLHPESEENDAMYPVAARLFRRNWFRSRYTAPQSVWHTSEPVFMFQWLAEYFPEQADGSFPQKRAEQLLVGMPYRFAGYWDDYARSRPKLARWKITASEDNGIIDALTAAPAEAE